MANETNEVLDTLVDVIDETQDIVEDMTSVIDSFKNGELSHSDMVTQFYRMRASLNNTTETASERLYIK